MTDELIASLIVVMAFFQVVFVIATVFKNNGLVDVSWGLGFIVASWIIAIRNSQFLIVLIPITIWGLRLAGHIYLRSRKSEEDWRYKKWREDWGKWTTSLASSFCLARFFAVGDSNTCRPSIVEPSTLE